MAYITQTDLLDRVSQKQLIQLTDDAEAGTVDATKVNDCIADAESEIHFYAAKKYSVPFTTPVPPLVISLDKDIATYNLWRRRPAIKMPDQVRTAYQDAVKKLEKIADGTGTLGIDPPPAASTQGSSGEIFGPARVFDRDKLGGF